MADSQRRKPPTRPVGTPDPITNLPATLQAINERAYRQHHKRTTTKPPRKDQPAT